MESRWEHDYFSAVKAAGRLLVFLIASSAAWACGDRVAAAENNATRTATASTVPLRLSPPDQPGSPTDGALKELTAKFDARADDWQTEVFADRALSQLKKLGRVLEGERNWEARDFDWLVVDDFTCAPLVPRDLAEVHQDSRISARRWLGESRRDDSKGSTPLAGSPALANALAGLLKPLEIGGARHTHFKLYRIEQKENLVATRVRYEAESRDANEGRQQTAVWNCEWTLPRDDSTPPQLRSIELEQYEEVAVLAPGGRLFVDCAPAALEHCPSYEAQVLPGINDWHGRMSSEFVGLLGHSGLAVGDVNGDLLDDLYVCDVRGLPNRLYIQQQDGTLLEKSTNVDFLDDSSSALLVDLDNDGDQDLVVAAAPILQIGENDGSGAFRLLPPIRVDTESTSISASDFDADGDLDLFVCGNNVRQRGPGERDLTMPVPYYDANNGGQNFMLRNEGDFQFVDVTNEVGLGDNNSRFSMAAAWEDFDDDGDQDLYVANDFGRNNLYRNDDGHFTDIANTAGVEDHASGMSVSWADYNRDGRMDVYVGNMFSSAGSRVTYQRQFSAGRSELAVQTDATHGTRQHPIC